MPADAEMGALLRSAAGSGSAKERLSALAKLQRELASLETETVAEGLREGLSWREIGEALGLSKQGAHRRHSRGVSRIDQSAEAEADGRTVIIADPVRAAVRVARAEAQAAGQTSFGTEHLLLGVLEAGGPCAELLTRHGVTVHVARDAIQPTQELTAVEAKTPSAPGGNSDRNGEEGEAGSPGRGAATSPLARRVLTRAIVEAARTPSRTLTAPHLLTALLTVNAGGAARTLAVLQVDVDALRQQVEALRTVRPPIPGP